MSEINRKKKFFRLPKRVDEMSEEEIREFARFVLKSIFEDEEEKSDEQ